MSVSIRSALAAVALLASWPAWAQGKPLVPPTELEPGITLEVTDLHRMPDKNAMQLKFVIANTSQASTSAKALGLATSYKLDEISLIDWTSKRSFTMGSASKCLCSTFGDGGTVAPGARREFWAWFGLPDPGVKTLSLQVADKPPIDGIPLQ